MRHRYGGYKLKRDVGARKSLLRNLVTSVILEERVITTVPKAKAIKPLVEKMITLAKADPLPSRRQAAAVLMTPASVKKLFDTLGTRFGQRHGIAGRAGAGRRPGPDRIARTGHETQSRDEETETQHGLAPFSAAFAGDQRHRQGAHHHHRAEGESRQAAG